MGINWTRNPYHFWPVAFTVWAPECLRLQLQSKEQLGRQAGEHLLLNPGFIRLRNDNYDY